MLPKLIICALLISASNQEIQRLPTDVVPTAYNLNLSIPETFFDNNYYSGVVEISLVVKAEVTSIQLHAKGPGINIEDVELKDGIGNVIDVTNGGIDSSTDILTIESESSIPPNSVYVLTISFTSRMEEKSMTGFYKSLYYNASGTKILLAATMFEPMGARKAFPCFDEPALKAEFTISVTYPNGYNVLANTPESYTVQARDDFTTTVFETTPPISTYLVAFSVSDFVCVEGDFDQIPLSVCARPGAEETTRLALELTPKVLAVMQDYTNYNYSSMKIGKLTQLAVPDMKYSMENWGLPCYRQEDLLWEENESSNYNTQQVLGAIIREVSRQWFGDLVTIDWWSDIYLKDGLAAYFEYYAADLIEEDWELKKQFVIEQLQPALLADSLYTSLPLSYSIEDEEEIINHLAITYNKGGSIIAMVQHILGYEKFKSGLATFLTQGSVGTAKSFWSSFDVPEDLPVSLSEIMDNWSTKAGYPLLTVTADEDKLTISQEQFLLEGTGDSKWYVPITYTLSNNSSDFTETGTKAWLTPDKDLELIEETDWIILNNQQTGFYRVSYDDNLLEKISNTLQEDINFIDEISRSQLVDDQLNLARAGRKTYKEVLEFLTFLKNDDSYYSWFSAFRGFSYLLQRISDTDLKQSFESYIKNLMSTLVASVQADQESPDQIYTFKQVLALKWLCYLGDEICIETSKQIFLEYTQDETKKPNPNLRGVVYCNALRYSDNASRDYEFLWNKFQETQLAHEYVTILKALGCINDDAIRRQYAAEALTYEVDVRRQDAEYVFSSVYYSGPDGVTDILDLIKQNVTLFSIHFPDNYATLTSVITSISDLFTSQEQIDSLLELYETEELEDKVEQTVISGIETAKKNLEMNKILEENLKLYFESEI